MDLENERNLQYMEQFYHAFPKMNALRTELSWTHYRLLIRIEREDIDKRMEEIIKFVKILWVKYRRDGFDNKRVEESYLRKL